MLPPLRRLGPEEWSRLRRARLTALKESPKAFLGTYGKEKKYGPERWGAEFDRGDWFIGELGEQPVCMAGVTREYGTPPHECYLEYVWLAAEFRGCGFAQEMLDRLLDRLQESGIRTVFLWVIEDNGRALQLYERLKFQGTGRRQALPNDHSRHEVEHSLDLTQRPVRVSGEPELDAATPFSQVSA